MVSPFARELNIKPSGLKIIAWDVVYLSVSLLYLSCLKKNAAR